MGSGGKKKSQIQYWVPMGLTNESLAEFRPYEVDQISWDVKSLDLSQRCVTVDGKPQGLVDVLISMDDLCEAPSDY